MFSAYGFMLAGHKKIVVAVNVGHNEHFVELLCKCYLNVTLSFYRVLDVHNVKNPDEVFHWFHTHATLKFGV